MGCGAVGGIQRDNPIIPHHPQNIVKYHRQRPWLVPRSDIVRIVQITSMAQVREIIDSKFLPTDDGNVCILAHN